jgi:hypothetical protein
MNNEDDYYDGDMSDDEYRQRRIREQERDEFYANARKTWKPSNNDKSPYRFSSDDDDMDLTY